MMAPSREPGNALANGPDHEPADRELVTAFAERRDELAFRALYRRHNGFLYALACRLSTGQELLPEVLVQDTWVRAVERIDRFRWESAFRSWLAGILFNCRREALKKAARDARLEGVAPAEATARVPVVEHQIDLERAIARLPDGYREVVVLHYVHGYPHDEIARMLGIAVGTSKSQASRGIKRLRATLGWSE